jgi:hypothetical protein
MSTSEKMLQLREAELFATKQENVDIEKEIQ